MYSFDGNNDSIFFSKIDKKIRAVNYFLFLRDYLSVNDSNFLIFIKLNNSLIVIFCYLMTQYYFRIYKEK